MFIVRARRQPVPLWGLTLTDMQQVDCLPINFTFWEKKEVASPEILVGIIMMLTKTAPTVPGTLKISGFGQILFAQHEAPPRRQWVLKMEQKSAITAQLGLTNL